MPCKSNNPLWAPWRIEFIRKQKKADCFLCGKKDNSSSPDEELLIHRGRTCFVIMNRYPYNSGHLMVAPYRHVGDLPDLDVEELHELMDLLVKSQKTLHTIMRPDGFNAGLNLGAAAGAGVRDHVHFHLVPRWTGDTNFMPVIGDLRVVPEALLETAALIRKNWNGAGC